MLDYVATAVAALTAWECGRILIRARRPVPAPAVPVTAEPMPVEVAHVQAEAAAALVDAPDGWTAGWDLFQYARRGRCHDIRRLPGPIQAWARGLSDEALAAVGASLPARIDRHIAHRATIRGVPHVPPLLPPPSLQDADERQGRSGGGGPRMGR